MTDEGFAGLPPLAFVPRQESLLTSSFCAV